MDEGGVQKKGKKLAPFNPTPDEVIDTALALLRIKAGDVVYDLGCGDARFLIAAAKQSDVKGLGVEYDKQFVEKAQSRIEESGLEDRITVVHENVLNVDLSPATSIFIYLVPEGMKLIEPM
jgi:tRNA1(Val) A37 N6-methylase TrmN6